MDRSVGVETRSGTSQGSGVLEGSLSHLLRQLLGAAELLVGRFEPSGREVTDRGHVQHHCAQSFPEALGTGDDGAVALRPDGVEAWRTTAVSANPRADLEQIMRRVLLR